MKSSSRFTHVKENAGKVLHYSLYSNADFPAPLFSVIRFLRVFVFLLRQLVKQISCGNILFSHSFPVIS